MKKQVNLCDLVLELNEEIDMSANNLYQYFSYETTGYTEFVLFEGVYIYNAEIDSLPDSAWYDKEIMKKFLKDKVYQLGESIRNSVIIITQEH